MSWQLVSAQAFGFNQVSRLVGGVRYAYTYNTGSKVKKSTDGGISWVDLSGSNAAGIEVSPTTGSVFLACNPSAKIQRSTDGGATWGIMSGSPQTDWVDIYVDADGIIYAVNYYGTGYKSTDDGVTWASMGLPTHRWNSICMVDGTLIAVSPYDNGYVYKSTNGGATWVPHNWGILSLMRVRGSATHLYAGTYTAAFLSRDSGGTWVDISSPLTPGVPGIVMDSETTALFCGPSTEHTGTIWLYTPNPPPSPSIYPSSGTFQGVQLATLKSPQALPIRYTLDGSEPTISSPLYISPIPVNKDTQIKAAAFDGTISSGTVAVSYMITTGILNRIPSYRDHVLPYLLEQYKGDNA